MKSRYFHLVLVFFVIPGMSFGQPRHSSGLGMIGGEYGINDQSYSFGIGYHRYISDKMSLKGRFEYSKVDFQISDYTCYAFSPDFGYTLFSNFKNIYLNGKAGAALGYETLENEVFTKKNQLFYGESIGLSLELFLRYNIKTEIGLEQRFLQKSLVSKYNPRLNVGLYFLLN